MAITNVGKNVNGVNSPTTNYNHTGIALNLNDYMTCVVHIDSHTAGTPATVTVSDGTNLWSRLGFSTSSASGHAQRTEVWGTFNGGAATRTINVAISGSYNSVCSIVNCYRGVDTTTPILDALAFTTNYTASSLAATFNQTVTTTGAMCLAFLTYDDQNNGGGLLTGSGFANSQSTSAGAGVVDSNCATADKVGAAGTQSEPWGNNDWWCVGGLTLKPFTVTETGTITTHLTKASLSLVAKETETGTITTTLTKVSQSIAAKTDVRGSITTTLTKASVLASAKQIFTGSVVTTLTKPSQALVGTDINYGVMATHLSAVSQAVAGKADVQGHVTTTLTKVSQALAGNDIAVFGTATTNLTKVSQLATGSEVSLQGSIVTNLAGISQRATSQIPITGSISTVLHPVNMIATAKEIVTGAAVSNLDSTFAFAIAATAEEIVSGHVVTNLQPFMQSLVAQEIEIGQIVTALGDVTGALIGNAVVALEIIEGPIVMNLPPFRPVILGAQLGLPGSGKWYSWRYADR